MRSTSPIPGNPWPHDMAITVEDRPHTLLELLWVREAHGLRIEGDDDLPPMLTDTPGPAAPVDEATRARWQETWPRVWRAAAAHAGRDDTAELMGRLQTTANGSPERLALLQELVGPSWRDEFGDDAFDDDSYREWRDHGDERHRSGIGHRLVDSPEHRDLADLIAAWQAGLTKIVTIPCVGEFQRRLSPTAMLMTATTRADSAAYRRALQAFA
ncbi:hypothetical protein IF188_13245 [Microbacterium sp. NEAU-LLC]|uniref:Uncharacterized protein n=1 Tax=Microbacterium helvum TaxID=2773713 RepID=A0ABR8NQF0_9MICO|nr:hypothetical protein [Microbacterium helvum]MBD3942662.1 hypothetical protein [Microbacterium helvum]